MIARALSLTAALTAMLLAAPARAADPAHSFDVLVYGGTSAGVTAAVEAARLGKHVALVEPGHHLGGLTSGGLGFTDLGNPDIVGGLARDFYHRLYIYYQDPGNWHAGTRDAFAHARGQGARAIDDARQMMWVFEPHAAEHVFDDLVRAQPNLTLILDHRLDLSPAGVTKTGPRVTAIRTESGDAYTAKIFIDATYEGDLLAKAGVHYVVGREANAQYHETIDGIQSARAKLNQLPKGIDAYVVPGHPDTGLLPGVNPDPGGPDGAADSKIQAYCYRMCLTDVPENRAPIEKPADYDERRYELLFRAITAGQHDAFFKLDLMPNRKTDSNNEGGISTDYIGYNYAYPDADYATREKIAAAHKSWQQGLVWTLQHHPRVPAKIREKYAPWGLPKDEFTDSDHWPTQLYIREARRMLGVSIATENTLRDNAASTQPIAMGAYNMDSHNAQRYADKSGHVRNEGDVETRVPHPYKIDYTTITPKSEDCTNLLVPVCLSATHIAYGSIRMEPVFMALGQSAGAAAAIAIDHHATVQDLPYPNLRTQLLADHQVLEYIPSPKQ